MSAPVALLGDSIEIPYLGFGTWRLRGRAAELAVGAALAAGYRAIDTAIAYGNERSVGRALRESGVPRDDVFIASKLVGNEGYAGGIRAVHESLDRLGLDYLDLYLVHLPFDGSLVDTWRALEVAHDTGLVRAIGVANLDIAQLSALLTYSDTPPSVNQVEVHPRRPRPGLRTFCQNTGIQVMAWAPLMQGASRDLPEIAGISRRHGKTPAQIVLRWHLQSGLVAIPSSTSRAHLAENLDILDFALDTGEMALINGLSRDGDPAEGAFH